jgi:DnaJ-class molecular chaperone
MKHGQKVVLRGEADQLPGTIPGDVIFVLAMEPHSRFQRNNEDLLCAQRITLVEALCGCQFLLEHLDGRKLLCKLVTPSFPASASASASAVAFLFNFLLPLYARTMRAEQDLVR